MGGWVGPLMAGACQQQGGMHAGLCFAAQPDALMAAEGHFDAAQLASLFCLTPADVAAAGHPLPTRPSAWWSGQSGWRWLAQSSSRWSRWRSLSPF